MRIPDFVQSEIDKIIRLGNLTERERELLELRNRELSIEECSDRMNCSVSTVNRVNKSLKRKIQKII